MSLYYFSFYKHFFQLFDLLRIKCLILQYVCVCVCVCVWGVGRGGGVEAES